MELSTLKTEYLTNNLRISWNTQELTRRTFDYMLKSVGDIDIKYLSTEHAEQYQMWLLKRYSKTTANIYIKTIRPAFRWAQRRRWIKDDIFSIPLVKVTKEGMRIYESDEVEAMLSSCPNEMWQTRILLAWTCGLRRSEVLQSCQRVPPLEANFLPRV